MVHSFAIAVESIYTQYKVCLYYSYQEHELGAAKNFWSEINQWPYYNGKTCPAQVQKIDM